MVDVEVQFNYEAEQPDELSIKVGDIIRNVVMSEGGWWEGELNGKKGMFPDNFVKVIKNPEKDTKKDEGKKKDVQATKRQSVKDLANKLKGQGLEGPAMIRKKETSAKKKRAKVVYSYEPENPDEIKLEVGDAVEVIKQEEEGWWEGIVNGKQGMFPSNFVELVEDSDTTDGADNKIENTEEHMIKGKKVQGIGLGNIFGDGPIKLRSTGGAKKPGDRPSDPPKAEKREEPVRKARESKATTQLSGEEACLMENKPPIPGGNEKSARDNVDKHPSFKDDVDYIDTDLCFMSAVDDDVDDDSTQLNLDITPSDFECIDSSNVINRDEYPAAEEKSSSSDESCADIDYNNNSGILGANRSYVANESPDDHGELLAPAPSLSSHTEGDYTERLINILDDLEECLDWSSSNSMSMMEENSVDTSVDASIVAGETSAGSTTELAEADRSLEKELKVLKCWNKTSVTPPQRLSFCKAIDSVLVTKKRLIDSAEKSPCQTPLHPASYQHQSAENASRALNFASGDLGATGFAKFIPETDSLGHTVLVAKPVEVHPHVNKASSHAGAKDTAKALPPYKCPVRDRPKYHTMSNSPQTYFASLNKSGNLSPFIRSIACKYHLFESQKQQKFEADRVPEIADPDESYTISLLSHQPDVQLSPNRVDEEDDDLSDPYVNQMVNNYVYDVISGQHCQQLAATAAASASRSDTGVASVDSCKADDISMAVCVDDNSVRGVNSRQDLDDDTTGLDEASILTLMSDRNDYSIDPDVFQWQSTPLNTSVTKSIPDKSQLNKHPNTLKVPEKTSSFQGRVVTQTPDKAFSTQWSQSSSAHKLPDSGNIRQTSSYCRIPFSDSKAPPFWFSKDFAQSPTSKLELKSRLKSPKRRSSELSEKVPTLFDIAEKVHLDDFREKLNAFKENNQDLSFESSPYCQDNRSPAKKRRKRTSYQVIADYHERHEDSGNDTVDSSERRTDSTDNMNWNALIQLPNEEMPGHVECFFSNDEDFSDKMKRIVDSTSPPLTNELEGNGSKASENRTKDRSESDRSCSASKGRLPCRTSVSFSAGYPEFPDITKRRTNRFFFGKRPSPNVEKEIPLKLLSYRKLDEEIIPKKHNRTMKSNPKDDIFSNFEHYTQNSLKVCSNKYNENDVPCKSDVEPFKEMNIDMLFENEKSSAVSIYFGTDAEFDCTFVEHPVEVCKQFLTQSCLGMKPYIESKDMLKDKHKGPSDVLNTNISLKALIESRSNMYSAISEAVQSCTDIVHGEADAVEGAENGVGFSERIEADQKSVRDEVYDVTPDAEAMITDLQSLNLSETPKYADNATDDAELKAFLQDAIGSLDDILTESFTSSMESPIKVSWENRNPDMQEKKTEFDDTFELQDDSFLKVIGRKCVLHEMDSSELQDEAIVKVFGRKSVPDEYKSGDARSQDGVPVDEDEGDYSVELQNDSVLTVTGRRCVMHEIDISVQELDMKEDYEIKSGSSKFDYLSQKKNNSLMENCTVRDISPLSASYDEVYDADGNMVEDNRQSAVCSAYERQPTYICTSPLIPYYATESTLKTEGECEEDRPLCESSPIVFPLGIDSRQTPDWESVVCTPDTAELMESLESNFDLQASSFFEETEEELNRTRGSSLDDDLVAVFQEVDQNVIENEAEGFDYTDRLVSEENIECISEDLNMEDIQLRMQDSGKWLEEFTTNRSGAAGDSLGLEGSILSDPVPPEFQEKHSFYPSPQLLGVDDD